MRQDPESVNNLCLSITLFVSMFILDCTLLGNYYVNYLPIVIVINSLLMTCNRIMFEPRENIILRCAWDIFAFMKILGIIFLFNYEKASLSY